MDEMKETPPEKDLKKPSAAMLFAQSILASAGMTFAMCCAVIISMIPAYGLLFLWNMWLSKWVGAEPLRSVWNVFGFMACVIVAINIISVLASNDSAPDVEDE